MPVIRREEVDGVPSVLERELETYDREKPALLARAAGKFVLIHGDEVAGTYESQADAIAQGYQQFGNVPFLVKKIEPYETPVNFLTDRLAI
jgi:hypothetical protein